MAVGKKVLKLRAAKPKFAFTYDATLAAPRVTGVNGKYYPAEDVVLKKGPTPVRNAPKVRASIAPGTVLILLAGRFRGKRVVCLKVLKSGLLLVSGPYATNGVPLRRVNQKYVIATSTSVSLKGVDVSAIDDEFFAREVVAKKTKEEKFFNQEAAATTVSAARKAAQNTVDAALTANINAVEMLAPYLQAKFSLSKADKPHLMKF